MSILYQERASDSAYIETVTRGYTAQEGVGTRPAENCWHLVFVRYQEVANTYLVGPWTSAGKVAWGAGGEVLWVRFKLGTFMHHLPVKDFTNMETLLPPAAGRTSFWLHSSAWDFPSFENVETFVDRLGREGILARDPIITTVLQDHAPDVAPRTVRHRFARATGLSHNHIRQIQRAQQAAALLHQGKSILDTVFEAGYFDQPHLTRSLKQFIGYTPNQIINQSQPVRPV